MLDNFLATSRISSNFAFSAISTLKHYKNDVLFTIFLYFTCWPILNLLFSFFLFLLDNKKIFRVKIFGTFFFELQVNLALYFPETAFIYLRPIHMRVLLPEHGPISFCTCQYTHGGVFKFAQFAPKAGSQIFNRLNIVEHFARWKFCSRG